MLSNTLTVTDGTTPVNFDLVSREGMKSIRREDGATSQTARTLSIQNTVDPFNQAAKNRHYAQLIWNEVNAETGVISNGACHTVITRDKLLTDASVIQNVAYLHNLFTIAGALESLMVGGN